MLHLLIFASSISSTVYEHFIANRWAGRVDGVYFLKQVFSATYGRFNEVDVVLRREYEMHRDRIRDPLVVLRYGPESLLREGQSHRLRIQIKQDALLASMKSWYTVPLADLALLEDSSFGERLYNKAKKPDKYSNGDPGWRYKSYPDDVLFPNHRVPDQKLPAVKPGEESSGIGEEWALKLRKQEHAGAARMDVRLIDADKVRLYHAFDGKLLVSVEPNIRPHELKPKDAKPPAVPPRELRTGKTPAEFTGEFDAHETKGGAYLLTHKDGRLYRVVQKGKDGLELEEVRRDKDCTVIGVVTFAEKEKCYVFGYAGKRTDPERFLFEMSPEPELKKYKITYKLARERDDSFREVYECVRAIKGDKPEK